MPGPALGAAAPDLALSIPSVGPAAAPAAAIPAAPAKLMGGAAPTAAFDLKGVAPGAAPAPFSGKMPAAPLPGAAPTPTAGPAAPVVAPGAAPSHAQTFLDTAKQEIGDFWQAHGADVEKGLIIGASAFAAAELLKTLKNAAFGKD